jgi:hypothetical protein
MINWTAVNFVLEILKFKTHSWRIKCVSDIQAWENPNLKFQSNHSSSLIASTMVLLLQSENGHIITAWERRVGFNCMLCIYFAEL